MVTNSPDKYINSDLNVRLSQVNDKDVAIIVDKEAILQSIYRLLNTEEGEIPFYRSYGINLRQFLQKPLGQMLAREIHEYISNKITTYEQRVEIYKVDAICNFATASVILQYYVRIKTTGEIVGFGEFDTETDLEKELADVDTSEIEAAMEKEENVEAAIKSTYGAEDVDIETLHEIMDLMKKRKAGERIYYNDSYNRRR